MVAHDIEGAPNGFSTELIYAPCDTQVKAIKYHRSLSWGKSFSCFLRANASSFPMNSRGACLMKRGGGIFVQFFSTDDNKTIKRFFYVKNTHVQDENIEGHLCKMVYQRQLLNGIESKDSFLIKLFFKRTILKEIFCSFFGFPLITVQWRDIEKDTFNSN